MSEGLLTVLKFCFLALVYLFLLRVVRVVMLELKASKVPVPGSDYAAPEGVPAPAPAKSTWTASFSPRKIGPSSAQVPATSRASGR